MIDLPPGYTVAKEELNWPGPEKVKYQVTIYRDPQGKWIWEQLQDNNMGRGRAWDHYEQVSIDHVLKRLPNA